MPMVEKLVIKANLDLMGCESESFGNKFNIFGMKFTDEKPSCCPEIPEHYNKTDFIRWCSECVYYFFNSSGDIEKFLAISTAEDWWIFKSLLFR